MMKVMSKFGKIFQEEKLVIIIVIVIVIVDINIITRIIILIT